MDSCCQDTTPVNSACATEKKCIAQTTTRKLASRYILKSVAQFHCQGYQKFASLQDNIEGICISL